MDLWKSSAICVFYLCVRRTEGYYYFNELTDSKYGYVKCQDNGRMVDAYSRHKTTIKYESLSIVNCQPTNYVDELKALNVDTTTLKHLSLYFENNKPLQPGNYTEGLTTVIELTIGNSNKEKVPLFEYNPNFLEPFIKLEKLRVSNTKVPSQVLKTEISVKNTTNKTWSNCAYLEVIDLRFWVTDSHEDFPVWPKYCTRLKEFTLTYLNRKSAILVISRMMAAAPSLTHLEITDCSLDLLPIKMIETAKNLKHLNLAGNRFYSCEELFTSFRPLMALRTLNLARNHLKWNSFKNFTYHLPALRELNLDDVTWLPFIDWDDCDRHFILEPLQFSSIESLYLRNTNIDINCFGGDYYSNLRFIYMSKISDVFKVRVSSLPKTSERLKVVYDSGRLFNGRGYIEFPEDEYNILRKYNATTPYSGCNISLDIFFRIKCDCEVAWLVKVLTDFPHIFAMPNLRCDNDVHLLDEPKENVLCDSKNRSGCSYKKSRINGRITAKCNKEWWIKMEPEFTLYGLNVSGESITSLHPILPESITWLDLRNNRISRASGQETAALFAAARRVWLAGNPLLCDCDNRALIHAIQQHREQVEDFNLLICVGTEEPLGSVSTALLCQTAVTYSMMIIPPVLIVIAVITAFILWRYCDEICMFLYSRGWCTSCINMFMRKVESDEKVYDVFLSYAHEDHEYVESTLLPGLENCTERFRVCVHYRDWPVGGWIPDQIMRSVQQSRRTLILLSKNFVASNWSILEFRYALANAAEETNAKVFMLVLDDVLDMTLKPEMRCYVTYHT